MYERQQSVIPTDTFVVAEICDSQQQFWAARAQKLMVVS